MIGFRNLALTGIAIAIPPQKAMEGIKNQPRSADGRLAFGIRHYQGSQQQSHFKTEWKESKTNRDQRMEDWLSEFGTNRDRNSNPTSKQNGRNQKPTATSGWTISFRNSVLTGIAIAIPSQGEMSGIKNQPR
jgi:hypothetical protein